MLATFVIALREGLEAALIVGIIAAFLKKNGHSLAPMWIGVMLAVLLSLCVGIGLAGLERALPQAAQEGLETVIGAVAIVFVTAMIFWMNSHGRGLKGQLEAEAAEAVGRSSAFALAAMAFLAVLKEGFETSVFLLATFSAAQSAGIAAAGAVIGLAVATAIGCGIYAGGIRLNLSRFFRITGFFLILVAAGLVVSALRTAHEAGWLNAGQMVAANLSWLVAPGTIRSALLTGVLAIPADPRLIELIGWLAYLLPVCILAYWPASRRPGPAMAMRLRLGAASLLAASAAILFLAIPSPLADFPLQAPIVAMGEAVGTARLEGETGEPSALIVTEAEGGQTRISLAGAERHPERHEGVDAAAYVATATIEAFDAPSMLSLQEVMQIGGGRLPRGLNPAQHPGPFDASWSGDRVVTVWTSHGRLLDAQETDRLVVSLSGSGLATPRTIRVADGDELTGTRNWQVSDDYRAAASTTLSSVTTEQAERDFWGEDLPIALLAFALLLAVTSGRTLFRARQAAKAFHPPYSHEHRPRSIHETQR